LEQEIAVFGMRVVIPAQAVVAESQERHDGDGAEYPDRKPIDDTAHRQVLRRQHGNRRCDGHGSAQVLHGARYYPPIVASFLDRRGSSSPAEAPYSLRSSEGRFAPLRADRSGADDKSK